MVDNHIVFNFSMKKVLFVLYSYKIGGTAVSTRNLISLLDRNKFDPYVWVMNDRGVLKGLYADCSIIKTNKVANVLMLTSYKEEKGINRLIAMFIRFVKRKSFRAKKIIYNYAVRRSFNPNDFDTIVACKEGNETEFVSYIDHPHKIAWMRCDYANYFSERQIKIQKKMYEQFSTIVCVSEKTMDGFLKVYPDFSNKTICIYNPQDANLLKQRAIIDDEDRRFKTDKIVIVSVGRVHEVKRFSTIPKIASTLLKKGLDFYWYIIGGGDPIEIERIKKEIEDNKVGDQVILLGAKDNAHYYIKQADLLVTVSRSEACPRVVNEAKILHTPVVSTDFRTIYEYIDDHDDGLIAPIEKIPDSIFEILSDKNLYDRIIKHISTFEFDNTDLMRKIDLIL